MKYDWRQLSRSEKEAMLKHFVLHRKVAGPVSAQTVCEEMQRTHHYLSCYTENTGESHFQFASPGHKGGEAISKDISEGIYKAALRTIGVQVVDRSEQRHRPRA